MLRTVLRLLFRATTLAALVIATAWIVWWLWPETPIRSYEAPGVRSRRMTLRPDGITTDRDDFEYDTPTQNDIKTYQYYRGNIDAGLEELRIERPAREFTVSLSTIAVLRPDYTVEVYDVETCRLRFTIPADRTQPESRDRLQICDYDGYNVLAIYTSAEGGRWDLYDLTTGVAGISLPKMGNYSLHFTKQLQIVAEGNELRVLVVFDAKTGQLLNRTELPRYDHTWQPSGDGRRLAYPASHPLEPGSPKRDWTIHIVSLPDFTPQAALPVQTNAGDPWMGALWLQNDRYLMVYYNRSDHRIWDMHTDPPVPLDDLHVDDARTVFSYPSRYILTGYLDEYPAKTPTTLTLYDADTRTPLYSHRCTCQRSRGRFSRDERYVVWGEMSQYQRSPSWMPRGVADFLQLDHSDFSHRVLDTQARRIVHTVPGDDFIGFGPDNATIWTSSMITDVADRVLFRQFPIAAPPAPWWLWSLTAAGVAAMIWDMRRTWRSRYSKSVEA
ncbi:MAG: hypothetical protein ACJ8C4_21645 [Gemmataceae bacterium]